MKLAVEAGGKDELKRDKLAGGLHDVLLLTIVACRAHLVFLSGKQLFGAFSLFTVQNMKYGEKVRTEAEPS